MLKSQSPEINGPGRPGSSPIGSDQSSSCDSQTSTGSATNSIGAVGSAIQDIQRISRRVTKNRSRENFDRDARDTKNIKIDPGIITV